MALFVLVVLVVLGAFVLFVAAAARTYDPLSDVDQETLPRLADPMKRQLATPPDSVTAEEERRQRQRQRQPTAPWPPPRRLLSRPRGGLWFPDHWREKD